MSKKCDDHPNDFLRERGSSQSPHGWCNCQCSLKKKRSRSKGKSCKPRSSSSRRKRKCKRSCGRKIRACSCDKSRVTRLDIVEKKTRIEDSTIDEIAGSETDPRRSVNCERKNQRKKSKKKKQRKKKKKKRKDEKKKKRKKGDGKGLSECSSCSRLVKILLVSCCCLKSLDSSSSSFLCTRTCRCCRCDCRISRPDCDDKYVQCEDPVVDSSLLLPDGIELGDSEVSSHSRNRESGKSRQCVTQRHSTMAFEEGRNDADRVEARETPNPRTNYRKNKSDGAIRNSVMRSFVSLRNSKKRRYYDKQSDDSFHEESKLIQRSEECLKFEKKKFDPEIKKCCANNDRGKMPKALAVIFDIVFWPYACLSRLRYRDCKNEKK